MWKTVLRNKEAENYECCEGKKTWNIMCFNDKSNNTVDTLAAYCWLLPLSCHVTVSPKNTSTVLCDCLCHFCIYCRYKKYISSPLKKIFVFYSRISYTLPGVGYLTGRFGCVARLLPWRLCSRVAWASLLCGGGSAGCWAVLRGASPHRWLTVEWKACSGVGCPLPLAPWYSHPWLWELRHQDVYPQIVSSPGWELGLQQRPSVSVCFTLLIFSYLFCPFSSSIPLLSSSFSQSGLHPQSAPA